MRSSDFGVTESTFGDKAQNFRPTASVAFLTSQAHLPAKPLPPPPPPCTSLFWKFHTKSLKKNLGERGQSVTYQPHKILPPATHPSHTHTPPPPRSLGQDPRAQPKAARQLMQEFPGTAQLQPQHRESTAPAGGPSKPRLGGSKMRDPGCNASPALRLQATPKPRVFSNFSHSAHA